LGHRMEKKKVALLIGTRPNFVKVTQFKKKAKEQGNVEIHMIHTGQHYDEKMSDVFFQQFGLVPDVFLNAANSSPSGLVGDVMIKLEKELLKYRADKLIVVGDVNSTLAGAMVANKMGLPLAHLESGLRSFDDEMPEEINRKITDMVSDQCFISEESGLTNLRNEQKEEESLHLVGNTMIDTLVGFENEIAASKVLSKLNLTAGKYYLMTMHRPRNVDTKERLSILVSILKRVSVEHKLVFPIHPRTMNALKKFGYMEKLEKNQNLVVTGALDYFAFQKLIKHSIGVITDSGGIQEETTFRGVPCLTLRDNTERPSTIDLGTNELVSYDLVSFTNRFEVLESGKWKTGKVPELWDGKATERILNLL
jgi:UDP-N-acetylglucosamine 2-epimerase (non-hydrolysing)